jgi:hypothetical protein
MSGDSNVKQPSALPLDSTQTVRAVTARELRDRNKQWFAVQLAVSDRPVNLEALPRFDVFATHRLYAIQGRLGANACYALRLGFFTEQGAARTICEDLQAYYRSASVVQVSEAEQARFEKVPTLEVPVPRPASTSAAIVEISSARRAPPPVAPQSTVNPPKLNASVNTTTLKTVPKPGRQAAGTQGRKKFKSLSQELLEEARQIELARSGRLGTNQQRTSWLSRLLGRSDN